MSLPYSRIRMPTTLANLAQAIGAEVYGDGSLEVVGCAPIDTAKPNEVSFLANNKYRQFLENTEAAAVIVDVKSPKTEGMNYLLAKDPYFAFRRAMIELHGFRKHPIPADSGDSGDSGRSGGADGTNTISPNAAIHPSAEIGEDVIIHPFAVVEAGAKIGSRTVLYPNCFIGPDSTLGEDCLIYPGVTIYDRCEIGNRVTLHANTAIGNDGFGYATHDGEHHKIPQNGIVVIEDDVEIGASCAIERAAMEETRICKGTKFADLISIGHGTIIGEHCLLVSLVGVSGSVKIGKYVVLGGQVGISGHLSVGDFVQAAGKTAIITDIPANSKIGGIPSVSFNKAKRNALVASDLAGLAKRVKKLEQRIRELEPEQEDESDQKST